MAKLYLGTREITPIVSKEINELQFFKIENGVLKRTITGQLTGHEFDGIEHFDTWYSGGNFYTAILDNGYFYGNENLTGDLIFRDLVDFLEQSSVWGGVFAESGINNVYFLALEEVGRFSLDSWFRDCENLETARFDKLKIIDNYGLANCFDGCTKLKNIYFNSLQTDSFINGNKQFYYMVGSSTISCTIHFPSNLETTISGLDGYPLFGGTSGRITLAFDLPATS